MAVQPSKASAIRQARTNPATWLFLSAYAGACLLFWWLPSILIRVFNAGEDPIENRFIWITAGALLLFSVGYLLPGAQGKAVSTPKPVLDRVESFSYWATIITSLPALLAGVHFLIYRSGVAYGEGHGISLFHQSILYTNLFFGLLYIGAASDDQTNQATIFWMACLIIAPRLLVSLRWGRFFAAQAVVPILFIAIARGWVLVSAKRIIQICLLALFIVFVPSMTRGDLIFGEGDSGRPRVIDFIASGTTIGFFQDNLGLDYPCPPLLVSLTEKVVPYSALGICTIDIGEETGLPAATDLLLTKKYSDNRMLGTGGNYLLELYLTGGTAAVIIGSVIFGASCRWLVGSVGQRSLYAGIWAECVSRALFAPRGNLGYVFERVPSLVVTTWLVVAISWGIEVLRAPQRSEAKH